MRPPLHLPHYVWVSRLQHSPACNCHLQDTMARDFPRLIATRAAQTEPHAPWLPIDGQDQARAATARVTMPRLVPPSPDTGSPDRTIQARPPEDPPRAVPATAAAPPVAGGWVELHDCRLAGRVLRRILLHPRYGIAIGEGPAEAPALVLQRLERARFPAIFPGTLPVVALAGRHGPPEAAFAAAPPLDLPGGDAWVSMARQALETEASQALPPRVGIRARRRQRNRMMMIVAGLAVLLGGGAGLGLALLLSPPRGDGPAPHQARLDAPAPQQTASAPPQAPAPAAPPVIAPRIAPPAPEPRIATAPVVPRPAPAQPPAPQDLAPRALAPQATPPQATPPQAEARTPTIPPPLPDPDSFAQPAPWSPAPEAPRSAAIPAPATPPASSPPASSPLASKPPASTPTSPESVLASRPRDPDPEAAPGPGPAPSAPVPPRTPAFGRQEARITPPPISPQPLTGALRCRQITQRIQIGDSVADDDIRFLQRGCRD